MKKKINIVLTILFVRFVSYFLAIFAVLKNLKKDLKIFILNIIYILKSIYFIILHICLLLILICFYPVFVPVYCCYKFRYQYKRFINEQ